MTEKMTFEFSGLVKDQSDIDLIEFWGHDAGEFVEVEETKIIERVEPSEKPTPPQSQTNLQGVSLQDKNKV